MTDTPRVPRQSDDSVHVNRDKLAPATDKRYANCCSDFRQWCETQGLCPLPAPGDTVVKYLEHAIAAGTPWSATKMIRSAIRRMHRDNEAPDPTQTSDFKKGYKAFEARMQSVGIAPKPEQGKRTKKSEKRTARDMAPDAVGALADRTGCTLIEAACAVAFENAPDARRNTYTNSCIRFGRWCQEKQLRPYPAKVGTVASYARALAQSGRAESTIRTDLTGIRSVHERTGFPELTMSPDLRAASRAAQKLARQNKASRAKDEQPNANSCATNDVSSADPRGLGWAQVEAMVAACPRTPCGLRNRALILAGYVTAANPEALAGMTVEDVSELTALGVRDRTIALDLDRTADAAAAEALLDWLTSACGPNNTDEAAPLFPSLARGRDNHDRALKPRDVNEVVGRVAAAAGIDGRITGRSLREGRLLDAARAGATLAEIKKLGGLVDDQSALRILARERDLRSGENEVADADDRLAPPPSRPDASHVHATAIRVVWGSLPDDGEAMAA
jgi:integrase